MGKNKLERFAEMKAFPHVVEPTTETALAGTFGLKGKWKQDFFRNTNPLVVELACGKGEYTVNLARKFPDKNFLGIDIKGARMWRGAKQVHDEGLPNAGFLRTRIELLTAFFDRHEVDEIWITFPDPQLKKPKKRLVSKQYLERYQQILKPGAPVHLKTDSPTLYDYTARLIQKNQLPLGATSADIDRDFPDDTVLGIRTFYEQQFRYFDIPITYTRFCVPAGIAIDNPEENKAKARAEKAYRDEIMPKIPVEGKPQKKTDGKKEE